MRSRFLPLAILLSIAAACTDPPPASDATETARSYECISVCYPQGVACHNLCRLTLDEPGFQLVPGPRTCDKLRQINQCGDGCCDVAEADRKNEHYCRADCRLERLEVLDLDSSGKLEIRSDKLLMGTVEQAFVSVTAACR